MGLLSKLFSSGNAADKAATLAAEVAPDDEDLVLGSGAGDEPSGPVEKRGKEKRRHPRIVQTTSGGVHGVPKVWVFGGRECYEDPKDESRTLSLEEAAEKAAMPRPDLEGKVELPRFMKMREEKKE